MKKSNVVESESTPYDGVVDTRLTSILPAFLSGIPKDGRSGAALSVFYRGECIIDLWAGFRNKAGELWQEHTIAPAFSTTKGVSSTLAHILAEQGFFHYDDPVAKYWPEFAQHDKAAITIRQVLTHSTGLHRVREMIDDAIEMTDWARMVAAIEAARPACEPGTKSAYQAMSYAWLIGETLQRATGKSFPHLLREYLCEPLSLNGLFIGLPESELDRRATLANAPDVSIPKPADRENSTSVDRKEGAGAKRDKVGLQKKLLRVFSTVLGIDPSETTAALAAKGTARFSFNDPKVARSCIPSANGWFRARDLAEMYSMLANRGQVDGTSYISPTRINEIAQIYSKGRDQVVPLAMKWRLGYHRVFAFTANTRHAFGHFGWGGSGAWCDPSRQLAVAYMVNNHEGTTPFGDSRIVRLNYRLLKLMDKRGF